MEIAHHFDPHTPYVPDAIERRSIRPAPPVTAVAMAVVLTLMLALIACRLAFTDPELDEIIDNVIVGIMVPLVALATCWHHSAVAGKQRRWAAARHRERELAEERLYRELAGMRLLLEGRAPTVDSELRQQVAELGGAVMTIQRQISAAVAGSFDPATKANIRSLNRELSQR